LTNCKLVLSKQVGRFRAANRHFKQAGYIAGHYGFKAPFVGGLPRQIHHTKYETSAIRPYDRRSEEESIPLSYGSMALCSDGLYNAISKRKLVSLSKDTEKLDELLFELHKLTLSSPLSDDATVVAAQF
jgi:serine/threonine protein phosphatase PrpC